MKEKPKKRIRIYSQQQFNSAIKLLRGEQNGNTEYGSLFLIRRALTQQEPKIYLPTEGRKVLKKELFGMASFSVHWRIRERQLVAIEILGMIGKNDPEILEFLTSRLKDAYNVRESEALQDAIDMINRRHKPETHALLAMTKTIKKEAPIESVEFTLLNLSVLLEQKNVATLSYPDAKEMYAWLQGQQLTDVKIHALVGTVLDQLKYIYPML